MLEQIVKVLVLLMVCVVALIVTVGGVLFIGTVIREFISDKIREFRRKRK